MTRTVPIPVALSLVGGIVAQVRADPDPADPGELERWQLLAAELDMARKA